MKARLSSRSVSPILEVLVILFFFSFVITLVLQIFSFAYQESVRAADLSAATMQAQTLAERLKAGDQSFLAQANQTSDGYTLLFDAEFAPATADEAHFIALITVDEQALSSGTLLSAELNISYYNTQENDTLCMVPITGFTPAS